MAKTKKRKAIIDDGMNPELVRGADFDGYLGVPLVKKPDKLIIPTGITPFLYRKRITSETEAIGFNEMDTEFSELLIHPENYVEEFRNKIIITPDCSLYRDAPLAVQIANIYRNRAIGYYLQSNGAYVIPQIRWGNALTYTTEVLPEKVAFLGAEKHSIIAIGTYGCVHSHNDKCHFKKGLEAMLETLEPEIVLVYGSMPDYIFKDYLNNANFVQYPDWITRQKRGDR